jgi:hypothetical protein
MMVKMQAMSSGGVGAGTGISTKSVTDGGGEASDSSESDEN